jgi:hypothetical protein
MQLTTRIIAGTVGSLGAMSLSGCASDGGQEGACLPTVDFNGKTYVQSPTVGLERSGKLATTGIAPCSDTSGSGAGDDAIAIELVSLQGVDTRIAIASARPTPGGGVYVIAGRCFGFRNAREITECIKNPVHFQGEIFVGVRLRRALTTEGPVDIGKTGHARYVSGKSRRCQFNTLSPSTRSRGRFMCRSIDAI